MKVLWNLSGRSGKNICDAQLGVRRGHLRLRSRLLLDALRGAAVARPIEQHAPIILDIVVTAIEEFVVPTGFNISQRNAAAA
jgi:hypothetical protein